MRTPGRRQQGITLVEVLVVLAVIAALAAVVVPNLSGFLQRGKERSYNADRLLLQASIDSWRTDVALRTTNPWPILEGGTSCLGKVNPVDGSLTDPGCNPYLDIAALATEGYLRDAGAVRSANTARNTTATNPSGTYGWYLNSSGLVVSYPIFQQSKYP